MLRPHLKYVLRVISETYFTVISEIDPAITSEIDLNQASSDLANTIREENHAEYQTHPSVQRFPLPGLVAAGKRRL